MISHGASAINASLPLMGRWLTRLSESHDEFFQNPDSETLRKSALPDRKNLAPHGKL